MALIFAGLLAQIQHESMGLFVGVRLNKIISQTEKYFQLRNPFVSTSYLFNLSLITGPKNYNSF